MDQSIEPRTIRDLAALLGVSSMTVHRAISGKPDISPETRDRILAEIERLGWRPNIAARGLRKGKTFTLGILVTNVAASFLPEVLQGVNQAAEAQGYHTFVCVHDNEFPRAERHLRTLQSKGVDGIVFYPTGDPREGKVLNQIFQTTPVVVVMREADGFEGPAVLVNDHLGGQLAARHLLELGHHRIGFMGYHDSGFTRHRREGLETELHAAGAELRPEWTVTGLVPGDAGAREAALRILGGTERPTALFCASDRLAARALQAAFSLGLRVPRDLSVVGFNGDLWAEQLCVPLTTVAQPRREVGIRAAEAVLASPGGATGIRHENGSNGHGIGAGSGNGAADRAGHGPGHSDGNGRHAPAGPARTVINPSLLVRGSTQAV